MEILYVLVPITLAIACAFLFMFIRSTKSGQFDDVDTPAHRILIEESNIITTNKKEER